MRDIWWAFTTYRDPELAGLILDLLRETGTRVDSIVRLHLDEIDWHDSTVLLHTKFDRKLQTVVSGDVLTRIAMRAIRQGWDGKVAEVADISNLDRRALRRADGRPLTRRSGFFDHIDRVLVTEEASLPFKVTPLPAPHNPRAGGTKRGNRGGCAVG